MGSVLLESAILFSFVREIEDGYRLDVKILLIDFSFLFLLRLLRRNVRTLFTT